MFRILSALALACALAGAAAAQDKPKQDEPKVSGGERDAAQKIEKAKGTEAKLQQAAAFVKKYPQSPLRAQIADQIAREIRETTDEQAKGSLAQTFLDIFNRPAEASLVTASLLNSYINTGQTQDAITLGTKWLAEHPDDIGLHLELVSLYYSRRDVEHFADAEIECVPIDVRLRRQALQSRDVIGQAKGILMERRGISADEAFDVLRRASQSLNIKLTTVAQTLVDRRAEI